MTKQLLYWKPVDCRNVRNQDYRSSLPDIISALYEGSLLTEIMGMPQKKPISFEAAIRLLREKQNEQRKTMDAKEINWLYANFVQFISDSGYHIQITGDEFVFHLCRDLEN